MKVLIIGTRFAPIPSVCGGAIESLIDEYLKYNSLIGKNKITVYSMYDCKINEALLEKYKNVNFRYVDKNKKLYKLQHLIFGTLRKFIKNKIGDEYIRAVVNNLKKNKELNYYDKIIILNNINNVTYICKKIKGEKILYLHNDYLNNKTPNCRKILRVLNQVWCVSKFIKKQVDSIFCNQKTRVLYNGTDLNKFTGSISEECIIEIKKKYNIKNEDFVVLYTGRIMKGKGVSELVDSFKIFMKDKNNVKLLIVGAPTDFSIKFYENLKLECNDNIIFAGQLSHTDFKVLYKIVNVQVVPSIWNEAFGLTVVEGMSAGIPMIVTDSGGIPELVDTNCALIIQRKNIILDLVEALNKIYVDKSFGKKIGEKAKLNVKKYSLEVFLKNIDSMILEKNRSCVNEFKG